MSDEVKGLMSIASVAKKQMHASRNIIVVEKCERIVFDMHAR